MSTKQLKKGQTLKYIGKPFMGFDIEDPLVNFLGYDSNGWSDIWIVYKEKQLMVNIKDVEIVK
jgi:hypothetical protein